jgi:RNA polymerase sigma-70 factor (ECF subfamily)
VQDKFLKIYSLYRNKVWIVAYSRCFNFEVANDLTQEAFLRYWRELTLGNVVTYERSWLCKVVRNLAEDYCKSSFYKYGTMAPETFEKLDSHTIPPELLFEQAELFCKFNRTLGELNLNDRQILEMRYTQNCRIPEIAKQLGLKSAAVKMRLFRARTRLAQFLKPLGFGLN